MRVRLAFSHTRDELFLVTVGIAKGQNASSEIDFRINTYGHEDEFLGLVMQSSLEKQAMFQTVQGVLLTINRPTSPQRWVELDLNDRQLAELQLERASTPSLATITEISGSELYDLFMQAPTPLLILMGPDHHYRFVNPLYLELMGRTKANVLGKSVREVYPEMKGQPFFGLLDRVYRTGTPFVGKELPCRYVHEQTQEWDVRHFDFIYQPIRNAAGVVEGVMVQATDVTQAVLARQVSEDREKQLFRQWTELEAIYRTAPIGLALIDARDFRFLRFNQRSADMLGCAVEDILGKCCLEAVPDVPGLREVLERAAAGEHVLDVEIEGELLSSPGVHRSWNLNATPVFDANGAVSAITTLATETTSSKMAEARLVEGEKEAVAGVLVETIVGQIADPLDTLRGLLGVVRDEIRRPEAHAALEVAEEELRKICGVLAGIQRRYGLPVESPDLADTCRP
ncbi:PAS domain S-box-containing protein [Granulicella pectinivorans]|uniref:PAS domain S-box-containing protein n=1 Tax=Granulicella pectinivorans TaxID=474950 RepID=A0A1I6LQT1_9BACT|nr:PAS domain S-box-containing protein [Granulicella pectinivorans]